MDRPVSLPAPNIILPAMREELRLLPAANNLDGSPAWMIQDPISNRFYRINWLDFEILSRWNNGGVDDIVNDINQHTTLQIEGEDVLELAGFLQQHQLTRVSNAAEVDKLQAKLAARKTTTIQWLLHHYLFFRIPIIKPQALLAKLLPWVKWVFSPFALGLFSIITLSGLYIVARQWDTFQATFIDQLTFAGIMGYSVALLCSKCLHELGHAFTATRYNVRVGHMGIAMLVMFPMPYTDTSESWKLTNHKQRLHIASAGIITELALAGVATLAWGLSPEGSLKNALFFLATTSWVLTLLVNMSPFMRFDGYFILSDLIDFPNLHERAGAQAKTWMRRFLLGFKDEWPESFQTKTRKILILFALGTWIYRLFLFLGIAWLVYYFFFKVLGILLFGVEIAWFVLMPIWKEISVWITRKSEIMANRYIAGMGVLTLLLVAGFVPWQSSVHTNGWMQAREHAYLHTPIAGKLQAMHASGTVQKGERLFQLTSPDIAMEANRVQVLAAARDAELLGLTGIDDGEARRANVQFQQAKNMAEVKLYQDELSRMDLAAPFSGELKDIDENLNTGTWVHPKQVMAVLINPNSWEVETLVKEEDITRIIIGDTAEIYPSQSAFVRLKGKVTKIDHARVEVLPNKLLDAQLGGAIATLPNQQHIPKENWYRVGIKLETAPPIKRVAAARVVINTQAQAWLPRIIERISAVLIRESGF